MFTRRTTATILKGCILFIIFFGTPHILSAQQSRLEELNKPALNQFARQRNAGWTEQKRIADSVATILNLPVFYIDENGRVVSLQRLGRNNKPLYYATNNLSVATTLAVDQVWSASNEYPELTGEGVEINLWDGGAVLATHQEFQSPNGSRITMRDLDVPLSDHSTHISGTMIAMGNKPEAKGMAGQALIKGWDLNNDIAEMASAAADGIKISNHSYGPLCGWYYNAQNENWYWYGDPNISAIEDYEFGFYSDASADLDYIAQLAPYYLIVKSAGNDRNDGPETTVSHYVWDGNWILVNDERDPDGGDDGYDCLSPVAVAKNILTIGAVDDTQNMTNFSGFGPTDDGRIKPDLVSNGVDVYSSISSTISSYDTYTGTSMSTAAATGAGALLLQLQNLLRPGVKLRSSTLKSILIHSAGDLGNPGPDYSFGWGLINIKAAADIMYDNSNNQSKNIYEEVLNEGEEITIPVKTAGDTPYLKATICWTDPAGQASSPALNQRTSKLVNDLNLTVENTTTGQSFLPWVLNVESPAASATHGTNHVDNVEQVYFTNPGDNEFNIRISHSGTLSGGSQAFSLVVTGIETLSGIFPPQNLSYAIDESAIVLSWDPPVSEVPDKYKIYRDDSYLGESPTPTYSDASIVFDNEYSYYVTAVYFIDNEESESLGTNEIIIYPRTAQSLPYIVDFESETNDVQIKNNFSGWQWGDSESLNCYYLDFSTNTSKFIAADSYSAGEAVHVSDIAATPPLLLANYSNVTLSFDYLLKTGIYDAIDELHVVYKNQEETQWHEYINLEKAVGWAHKTVELLPEICKNGTQLGFYYDDLYQWGMGAGLDNISVSGEEETRVTDLTITALNYPFSACSFSNDEKVSIVIKNLGPDAALAGDSITLQMTCTSNESIEDTVVLTTSLLTNEVVSYEMNSHLDLSNELSYTVEFLLACPLDTNVANNTFEKTIETYGTPQPTIVTTDLTFCQDESPILIEVLPEGGVLSGEGVSGLYFSPVLAGPGTYTLSYIVTDVNGCTGETTFQVIVDSVPHPEILNSELSFCEDQPPVLIEALPEGGTLSGAGVSGLYFDPSIAGPGTHTLTYTVTENECTGETEFQVIVDSMIHPQILNDNLSFCEDQPPVLIQAVPEGGVLSGAGVSGLYFDPTVAGPGTHTLTYAVTENECTGETEFQVIVDSIIHPQILNDNLSFCEDLPPVLIQAIPEDGVLSGAGVSGLYFDPSIAGPGTHTLTYTLTENNCTGETEFQVIVDSMIHPQILNDNLSFCEDQPPGLILAIPEGGILSGAGVSGLYFDPSVAGPGTHTLTYSVTENACTGETEFQVIVDSVIHPQILNDKLSFCEDQPPGLILAIPEGGILSGAGVSGLYFDPSVAGPGTHTLTYSVTENACTGETEFQVIVDSVIHPQILNDKLSFCEDQPPVLIEAIPEGGILSGAGVSGLYFDPSIAGPGTHMLTYTVTENECTGETEFQVIVDSVIHPQILNDNLSFCEDQPPVFIEALPEGGTLSGTGVSGLYFDPSIAGTGTHTLTYTVTENNCTGETKFQVIVDSVIHPQILNDNINFCEDQPPVLIEAIPEGGTLSGAGVSGLYFDPSIAGPGTHTITYTISENGCTGETEFQVIVDSMIHPEILNDYLSFCEDQPPILIEAVPEGGILSGAGVSGLYFDPSIAGPGTHTLTYIVNESNCTGENEFQVIVDSMIHPQILNDNLSFCQDQQPGLILAIPEGGILSGAGVSGLYFDPAVAGPGTHTLTYSVTENECTGETEFQVIVDSVIHPQILNDNLSFCEDQQPVLIEVIPEGGILSGAGVSGLYFDPSIAGPGTHTITYTISENGCTGETEFQVIVDSMIHPEILNDNLSFCQDQPPVLIEALPEGGILSGTGVSGLYFDPSIAGPGTHTLTYTLTENNCTGETEFQVIVDSVIHPQILNDNLSFCEDQPPVLIEALPEGGILSGTGVSGLYFDPSIAGPGTHTLTYTLTENNCTGETEFQVIVDSVIHPQILNDNLSFCEDQPPVLIDAVPEGGTLSGAGVSGLYFDPTVAGPGTHNITYTISENGCTGETEFQVIVDSMIHPEILNDNLSFCQDQPPVLIQAIPEGGTLSGAGVSGLYFDPSIAGPGTHTLSYTVTEKECIGETEIQVIVDSAIHPQILNDNLSFCENQQPVLIEAIPEGGTLSGAGVSGLYFDPAVAGPGMHTLTYTVTENECTGETKFQVIVDSMIHPQILNDNLSFCEDQPPVLIEAIPEGGTLSGAGVSGLYFDPLVAGPGTYSLIYTLTENGCIGDIEVQVVVYEKAEVDLGPDQVLGIEDSISLSIPNSDCSIIWCDGTTEADLTIVASELGLGIHPVWVKVFNESACYSTDTMFVTVENFNAVSEEETKNGILIYPNPANTGFTVQLNQNETIDELIVFAATGEMLINKQAATTSYFDISFLSTGVYFIKIKTNLRTAQICLLKL
ncbi:S8 family serine peptidase [uncultured Draconibacterium sp.]|uniref:S8 family serine peptidase n=1 Tax=uncultured Draconibacterium sp. TaxID=1573823 RepID=UPI0029C7E3DF|nr:S8 family serine peptidase [uncultured Draconibacterium sp.]